MSTVPARLWPAGLQSLLESDTEQSALNCLIALCAQHTRAPAAGLLVSRAGFLQSVSPDTTAGLCAGLLALAQNELALGAGAATAESPAHACLRVLVRGRVAGAVALAGEPEVLERALAELAGLVAAFGILVAGLRERADLELLADVSAGLGAGREPDDLARQLLALLQGAFGATQARLLLLDERAGDFVLSDGALRIDLAGHSERLSLAGTLAGQVLQRGQGLAASSREGQAGARLTEREAGLAEGQALCVPLRHAGRAVGALLLASLRLEPSYTGDDLKLLETIGGMLGLLVSNARLHARAVRDALTGAYNRGAFNAALEQLWQRANDGGSGFTLILLDLDDFKQINDRFGHSVGDQVLQAVTRILWEALRSDDMIFRYGGEEFCVLLPTITEPQVAATIAERLRAALDCMLLITGFVRVPISASLGVAVHPLHGALKPGSVLDIADDAAYQAKRDGKNRVVLASVQDTAIYAASDAPATDVTWQYE